jgi:hypothetical protein
MHIAFSVDENFGLGIPESHGYFNAGVLVMDLNALRRHHRRADVHVPGLF